MSDTEHMPAPHRRESRGFRAALGSRTAQRWAGGFFLAALLFFTGAVVWAATVAQNQPKQARAAEVEPSMLTMPRKPVTEIVSTGKTTRPAARKTLAPAPRETRTRIKAPKRPARARTSPKPSRSPSLRPSRSPSASPSVSTSPSTSSTPIRFANCTDLRKVHPNGVPADHPAYERKHDRDGDGTACERD